MNSHASFNFETIGIIHSCFKEKFGIPRQPGLVEEASAVLELLPPFNRPEAVRGLEGFSHIWVIFVFHGCLRGEWKPTVRPPRLGGNARIGVFASRATYRPNPIGMSPVRLTQVEIQESRVLLHLKGVDLLDGTPVLDIKPYIPYADNIPQASGSYAEAAPALKMPVHFSELALEKCRQRQANYPNLQRMIEQLLASDPRPAYQGQQGERIYGMRLWDFDLQWQVKDGQALVLDLLDLRDRE